MPEQTEQTKDTAAADQQDQKAGEAIQSVTGGEPSVDTEKQDALSRAAYWDLAGEPDKAAEERAKAEPESAEAEPSGSGEAEGTDAESKGQEAPAEPEKEQKAEDEGEESEQGEQSDGEQTTDPDRLAKARNALKRWQYPDELLERMDENEVLERGEKALESQREQDRLGNQKKQLEQQLEEILAERQKGTAGESEGESESAEGSAETDDQAGDNLPEIEPLIEALKSDELHEGIAEPLQKTLTAFQQKVDQQVQQLNKQVEQRDQELSEVYRHLDNVNLNTARRELRGDFPQLDSDETFQSVRSRVYQLANLTGYRDDSGNPDWTKLVKDAARLEGLERENQQQQQDELAKRYYSQAEGQPSDEGDKEEPQRSLSKDDAEQKAYRMLEQGKTPEEIRAELNRMSVA